MKKIKIKLKECCLTCERFDPSGIKGLSLYTPCCGGFERVIACGHMEVCEQYNRNVDTIFVVRCKNCKYLEYYNNKLFCAIHGEYTQHDYFCGSGERRNEAEANA